MATQDPERHALLPVLPLPDVCLFPEASLEVTVMRPGVVTALDVAGRCGGRLLAVAQKEGSSANVRAGDLQELGTIALLTDSGAARREASRRVELDGVRRARLLDVFGTETLIAEVELLDEGDPGDEWGGAVEALARYMHAHADLREFLDKRRRSREPMGWVNLACQHLPITMSARQKLLNADAAERCRKIGRGLEALLRKERSI